MLREPHRDLLGCSAMPCSKGCRSSLDGCCLLLAAGRWMLAAGCWLLAAGCWLMATGCWLRDARKTFVFWGGQEGSGGTRGVSEGSLRGPWRAPGVPERSSGVPRGIPGHPGRVPGGSLVVLGAPGLPQSHREASGGSLGLPRDPPGSPGTAQEPSLGAMGALTNTKKS